MADKTSLIIKSVDQNNKATSRSVTEVSKTATAQQLKAFAQALNATSDNTYQSSSRVQTTDLDNAQPETPKLPRNLHLELDHATIAASLSNSNKDNIIDVMFDGGGNATFIIDNNPDFTFGTYIITGTDTPLAFTPIGCGTGGMDNPFMANGHVTISVAENETHAAESLIVTITGGE